MIDRCALALCLVLATATFAADPPTKAHLRADGTLMVNGESVFPLGIASATLRGENCAVLADVGFNIVMNGGDCEDAFFGAAHAAGLLALAPHYNWATFARKSEMLDLDAHEERGFNLVFQYADQVGRTIEQNLAGWDHLPGVMGWYIAEEPKAAYSESMEFMYEVIRSRSPAHLVVVVSAEPVWYHHFARACDVLMVDVFPYRPGDRAQPEVTTYEVARAARAAVPGKAVWVMGQGGKMWKNWSEPFPTLELAQFRNQAYLALIAGAKGYFVYSAATVGHFGALDDVRAKAQWEKLRAVLSELKRLSPAVCDGRESDAVRLNWQMPGGKGVPPLTRVLDYYGDQYVLVANLGSSVARIQVLGTNYGLPAAYDAAVLNNKAALRVEGDAAGRTIETVNESKAGRFPVLVIEPGHAGAFKLTRRPAPSP